MKRLTGLIAATFTPMDAHGQINLDPIPDMVEALLAQHISGLYVCGSTGESPSLTTGERKLVAQAFVGAVQGLVPVVVQVGHNSIEDARSLAAHAEKIGADAISAVSPSYFKPEDARALAETMGRIADAAPSTPFYYYHIPRLSGIALDVPRFLEQASARIPTLAGVKFSCQDLDTMQRCRALDKGRYNILFGVDEMLLSGLAAGCDGAVGSTYNFLAPLYHEVMRAFAGCDLAAAQAGQRKAADFIQVMLRYHGMGGLKAAMSLTGIPCGPPRLPLTAVTQEECEAMRAELAALGFFTYATRKVSRHVP
jgi:N-acetylneuraminate lyase